MSISVGILVKNDAILLRECLSNLVCYFDNIAVIDNGSTDDSVNVAKEFNCKIIDAKEDLFDEARNRYLDQAKSEWVLFIDTDERITENAATVVNQAIKDANNNLLGCYLPRFEYIGNGRWSTTWVLRLIRVHPKVRYPRHRALHTSVRDSINEIMGETQNIYAQIHHLDILLKGRAANKRKRYIEHLLMDIKNDNYDSSSYYYLGLEYTASGDYEQAEKCYRTSINLNPSIRFAQLFLAQHYLHLNELEKSKQEAEQLLDEKARIKVPALIILAEIADRQGKREEAVKYCLETVELEPLEPSTHLNVAALLEQTAPELSLRHLQIAMELNPYLLNTEIYGLGEQPNLFQYQISFLSRFRTVFEHMQACYKAMGDYENAVTWERQRDVVFNQ